MRVLIYKRTHVNDPNKDGVFGVHDCMRSIRCWNFDAVIGIGGIGAEPQSHGIARKINWVGVGAHKQKSRKNSSRSPVVIFDHFLLMDEKGPEVALVAPELARHMYDINRRVVVSDSLPSAVYAEVIEILKMAGNEPSSSKRGSHQTKSRLCAPHNSRKCR